VVAKETIELTFLTAIQRLQPLPRAVFILRDVLDCSAKETAELLETTVASVNSALQRAHAGLREHLPEPRAQWRPEQEPSAAERELLARYVEASEQADPEGFVAVLHDDVRFWMPPQPGVWEGRDTVVGAGWRAASARTRSGRCAAWSRGPTGSPRSRATSGGPATPSTGRSPIDVLHIEDGWSARSSRSTAACSGASTCPRASRPSGGRRPWRRRAPRCRLRR
jgi:RNA polymerase sigma-70 factor (ECF subfamily)